MPTPATDRHRTSLIAVAVTAVALTALAFRVVAASAAIAQKPVPATDLESLSSYLAPLSDSTSLAASRIGTMVVDRDPFGAMTSATRSPGRTGGAEAARGTSEGSKWVVSSILFEDSRRSAIVNNAWVNVGDPLGGGARVTAIERKYVVVTDANGNRHVVSIQGGAQ